MRTPIDQFRDANPVVILLFGWAIVSTAVLAFSVINAATDVSGLQFNYLKFEDGLFEQSVTSDTEGVTVRGKWAAEIVSTDGAHICSGGGIAPYAFDDPPIRMSADDWTGGDCSDLTSGQTYTARAVWEWRNGDRQSEMAHSFDFVFKGERP